MVKRRKEKFNNPKSMFRVIVFFSFILTFFLYSVFYASLASDLKVSGRALVKSYGGRIRITNIRLSGSNSNASIKYNPTYYSTLGSFGMVLPKTDSSITYTVVITNESDSDKMFKGVVPNIYSNDYAVYTYSGIREGNIISPGESVEISVTFKWADYVTMVPIDDTLEAQLLFEFNNDSFDKLVASIDTITADFSTGNTIGDFTVEVYNPNDFAVDFSFLLGNTELLLFDDNNQRERLNYGIGAFETKEYVIHIMERDNTISDSLNIVTALNIITNSPEYSLTEVTDSITIRLPNKAKYVVLDDNEIVTRDPVFSGMHTDSGLFKNTSGLEGGTIYFFRGNVNNNYVSYANKIWRILQLDDYMNVRLILDDTISASGWYSTDQISSFDDAMYAVDYDNSLIKPIVDSWFNTNIVSNSEFYNLVRDSKFCVDFSYEELTSSGTGTLVYYFGSYVRVGQDAANYAPIFTCPSQYLRTYQIGLIGADEISYAGGFFNNTNSNFFLKNSNIRSDIWSISPSYYDVNQKRAGMFILEASGRLSDWTSNLTLTTSRSIRPVITLDGSLIISGNGTIGDPYVFGSALNS